MTDWPAQADYRDALQNVATALRLDVLKVCADGEVEQNKMKVPRARAGAFASVYKLVCPGGGAVALKLFNFPSPDRQRRYQAVVDHLKKLKAKKAEPAGLVPFHYEAEGIYVKVKGQRRAYPVQTMEWVKGTSLGEWVRATMAKKDHAAVRTMADLWAKMVAGLQDAKIAHGDLQHDNVMVVNNAPVLVDYDGMVTPDLEGDDQLEFGKPAYQHPKRGEQKLSLRIDDFSAWIIQIALRASAADPGLYDRYVTKTENENLLFMPEDLQDPKGSRLWPELTGFKADKDVAGWAKELRAALDKSFTTIPAFALDPFEELRNAKEWGAVAAAADRLEGGGKAVPADLAAKVAEARRRVAVKDRVQTALDRGDPRGIAAAYDPAAFTGWAEAAALKDAAEKARKQIPQLDALKAAAAAPGDGRALVELWDRTGGGLAGVAEADGYRKIADGWRGRIRAADDYRRAAGPGATERAVADAWKAVAQAGPPHPSLAPADRARGEEAGRRADALDRLRNVPTAPTETADRALVAVWDGPLLGNCREADPFARKVRAAEARLELVKNLIRAVAAANGGGSEQGVVDADAALQAHTAGYEHAQAQRVQRAADAVKYSGELGRLLTANPASDVKIAETWTALKVARPAAAAGSKPAVVARCDLAVRRVAAIRELDAIDKGEKAPDKQDRKWYEGWKRHKDALDGCHDAGKVRDRAKLAYRRLKLWAELTRALDAADMAAVDRLADAPELKGYPPVVASGRRIEAIRQKARQINVILGKLRSAAAGCPLGPADLTFLRENHGLFEEETLARVVKAVEHRLQTRARLTPGQPAYQSFHPSPSASPLVKVRWEWAEAELVSSCVMAHDPARHLATPADAGKYSTSDVHPDDHQRNGGGAFLPWPGKLYVTVWPTVELGWTRVVGPPLHVGPIPPPPRPAAPVGRR